MINLPQTINKNSHNTSEKTDPLAAAYARGQQYKAILLEGSLSQQEVTERLGIDDEAVDALRKDHKIIAIALEDQNYCYPLQQFNDNKIVEGLEQVLSEMNEFSALTQLMFLTTGDIRLEGKTPLECLKMNQIDQVIWAASCYGKHIAA